MKTNIYDITKSVVLLIIVVFVFFAGNKIINNIKLKEPTTIVQQIDDNIIRVLLEENREDFKLLLKEFKNSNKELMTTVKEQGGRIEELATIIGTTSGEIIESGSDRTTDGLKGYTDDIVVRLDNNLPVARMFYNYGFDEPWTTATYDIGYNITIVETEDDRYVEMAATNTSFPGEKFPIQVDANKVRWAKRDITNKFRIGPRISLTGSIGLDVGAGLDMSLFSYGKTKSDIVWRFIGAGVSYSNNFMAYAYPVEYNLGKHLPLVENLFTGPAVTFNGVVGGALLMSVPF